MNPEQREEWVSAYLDGELSADQRAQVESWLTESAELRQFHDDLLAMRRSVKSLASHKLDQDLAPAVLRRAERAVLGGGVQRARAGKIEPHGWIRAWWAAGDWRRWAWPSVALAAALLLLMFDNRQQPAQREVARAPKGETSIAAGVAKDAGEANHNAQGSGRPGDAPGTEEPLLEGKVVKGKLHDAQTDTLPKSEQARSSLAKSTPNAARVRSQSIQEAPQPVPALAGQDQAKRAAPLARPRGASNADDTDEAHSDVVCDVTDEFIRQRSFEKLLNKKKIAWQRGDVLQQSGEAPATKSKYQQPTHQQNAASQERLDYLVTATPKQVDEIVVELQQQSVGVNQISNEVQLRRSRARKVVVDSPNPVIFTFQSMPEAPPGEPKPPG